MAPTGCTAVGYTPSVTLAFPFTAMAAGGQININASTGPANGTITAFYVSASGSGPFTTTFTGQEVGRTFVPEPGTAWLVGLGLAALSAGARRAVSRRKHLRL